MTIRWGAVVSAFVALAAHGQLASSPRPAAWDVTAPRGAVREIDFVTDQGTWMSVDISPDGRWIIFDLLGNIYRVPAAGGDAELLTRDSGIALNFHPRYSPDGQQIAFISDRAGQNNLWVMSADGARPRSVFRDDDVCVVEPVWLPDGSSFVVRRLRTCQGGKWCAAGLTSWIG